MADGFPASSVLSQLSREHQRDIRLDMARAAREFEREQAARHEQEEARLVRALHAGHRPHAHAEILAGYALEGDRLDAKVRREAEHARQERLARREEALAKARTDGRPHGPEVLARYFAPDPEEWVFVGGHMPDCSCGQCGWQVNTEPRPVEKETTVSQAAFDKQRRQGKHEARHEAAEVRQQESTTGLWSAITKLKARLSGQGIDPLGKGH